MLCRKFELIPIKFRFFTILERKKSELNRNELKLSTQHKYM